jgi:hypothetical protein
MALGRLANYSDDLAEAVVQNEILPQLVRQNARPTLPSARHGPAAPVAAQRRMRTHVAGSEGPPLEEALAHDLQVYSLSEQNRFYKKAAGYCLRAVAKHSPELAQAVVDSGALDSLVTCLEEFDPGVKVR